MTKESKIEFTRWIPVVICVITLLLTIGTLLIGGGKFLSEVEQSHISVQKNAEAIIALTNKFTEQLDKMSQRVNVVETIQAVHEKEFGMYMQSNTEQHKEMKDSMKSIQQDVKTLLMRKDLSRIEDSEDDTL